MAQYLQAIIAYMPVITILGGTVLAGFLGHFVARTVRMKDYGWKLAIVFSSLTLATTVCIFGEPKQGIDLSGGTILIYEVDETKTVSTASANATEGDAAAEEDEEPVDIDIGSLIEALRRRIDPSGVREIVIRPYGPKQIEIIVPRASETEIAELKRVITKAGYLKFRIVADKIRNPKEWSLGEAQLKSTDETVCARKQVMSGGSVVAEWVKLGHEQGSTPEDPIYKIGPAELGMLTREFVPGELEVLMVVNPDERFHVEGRHLRSVVGSFDQNARPCVNFRMNSQGSKLFGMLTRTNLPDNDSYAHLGIVMDDILLSAPRIITTIMDNGEITGNFTQAEVDELVRVLKAGRLPAVLRDDPISDYSISALLGKDTIRKGSIAIIASMMAVLVFMLIYYRFAGIIACCALVGNLVLIVALMTLIDAAFTLPGLAGLVLTVGMSVDANVLIFERIREERRRGATLRMAIRNGFDRATRTIVDANVTTLITALVLYVIGTDQIRGFAVTLFLGILMSMYTAIFCSRIVFDISERRGWLKKLNMMQILGETNINFLGMRKLAATVSIITILVGLAAVVGRGKKIFDIDFNGGTSVQAMLKQPMQIGDVRVKLSGIADDVSVTEVNPEGLAKETVYKIDTSLDAEEELHDKLREVFRSPTGESQLVTHSMEYSMPVDVSASTAAVPSDKPTGQQQDLTDARDDLSSLERARRPEPSERLLAWAGSQEVLLAQAGEEAANTDSEAANLDDTGDANASETTDDANAAEADVTPDPLTAVDSENATDDSAVAETADETETETSKSPFRTVSKLTFDEAINAQTLRQQITRAADAANAAEPLVKVENPKWDGASSQAFTEWNVRFSGNTSETTDVLEQLKQELSDTPAWLSSNKIGSSVAGDMKRKAVAAILVSLVGIVAYIWIRFQRVGFGLAAVVALVHDVSITLGAVAVSFWLAQAFGFLLIDEFKISLPVVAAFMTIIGYSLNDTIVVFDRIREVRGKSPALKEEMINTSINQTLSRTLLTSTTTMIVVLILYTFGGDGIHGFAYALLIGVLVGTYSSIFVASPALLWMAKSRTRQDGKNAVKAGAA